jgi:hypothetical protein
VSEAVIVADAGIGIRRLADHGGGRIVIVVDQAWRRVMGNAEKAWPVRIAPTASGLTGASGLPSTTMSSSVLRMLSPPTR